MLESAGVVFTQDTVWVVLAVQELASGSAQVVGLAGLAIPAVTVPGRPMRDRRPSIDRRPVIDRPVIDPQRLINMLHRPAQRLYRPVRHPYIARRLYRPVRRLYITLHQCTDRLQFNAHPLCHDRPIVRETRTARLVGFASSLWPFRVRCLGGWHIPLPL